MQPTFSNYSAWGGTKTVLQSSQRDFPILAVLPLLASFFLFHISPVLAIALQVFVLCAVLGKLPFFLMAVFAAMPFQQSLAGETSAVNLSLVDVLAALLFLILLSSLPNRSRLSLGPIATPLLVYLGISCASSLANWEGFSTVVSLARMFMATLVAILVFANFTTAHRLAHRGFAIFLIAVDVLALFSIFAFATGGVAASMYTLGINKNALGPTFGCGIVTCMSYLLTETSTGNRKALLWSSLALTIIGCFLSLSRGAWIATFAAYMLLLMLVKNKRAFWGSLLFMVPLLAILWHMLPQDTADYASNISTSAGTVQSRFEAIATVLHAFYSSPIMGVGIGLRKVIEPHNVLILTLGESGIIGLIGFLGMFTGGFYTFYLAAKKPNISLSDKQLIYIGSSILLLSIVHGCMDVYWRRGVGFLGWASVGLAVQILLQSDTVNEMKSKSRRKTAPRRVSL